MNTHEEKTKIAEPNKQKTKQREEEARKKKARRITF
jgi:hypothetical protein